MNFKNFILKTMSLGILALAVGTQIGKTQKSSYLRDIEEQKRQEQQKVADEKAMYQYKSDIDVAAHM